MAVSIYLNVPFGNSAFENKQSYASAYAQALINEVESYREDNNKLSVDAVYFVNGDVTLLPIDKLVKLLDVLKEVFEIKKGTEIRLQGSHNLIQKEYLDLAIKHGVNSIYMDVRAVGERACKMCGVKYVSKGFEENVKLLNSYEKLKKSYNYQLDLNGYSVANWTKDFHKLMKANPDVVDLLPGVQETELGTQELEYATNYLKELGYTKNNLRFSRKGIKANKKSDEIIGVGISMVSMLDGMKTRNTHDFSTYLKYSEYPEKIIVDIQKVD